jgi:protein phosphatase 2C family protein 2/3
MGQTLSQPITSKETASCANNMYTLGSSSMQGWRINMEDSHTHLLSLPDDNNAAFFAVYDGHGGARVANYASMHLHKRIVNHELYAKGEVEEALRQSFLQIDEQMMQDDETREDSSGTTAITVLIKDSAIYCANVGDSRAVASIGGEAVPMSNDHKPTNDEESKRIVAAGGWVEFSRVNGNLALSRALGDFGFKRNDNKSAEEQVVTANPEILKFEMTREIEFLVLACDGIWDVMSNQEVVDFCRERLANGLQPEVICEQLLDRCLAPDCEFSGLGCDNMTVILVCLLHNEPMENFLERVRIPSKCTSIEAPGEEDEVARSLVQEQLAELGLKQAARSGHSAENPLTIDTISDGSDEQFITPNQSPNGHSSQEACSDDEQPPTHFKVPPASLSPTAMSLGTNEFGDGDKSTTRPETAVSNRKENGQETSANDGAAISALQD